VACRRCVGITILRRLIIVGLALLRARLFHQAHPINTGRHWAQVAHRLLVGGRGRGARFVCGQPRFVLRRFDFWSVLVAHSHLSAGFPGVLRRA